MHLKSSLLLALMAVSMTNIQAAQTLSANLNERLPEPYVNDVLKQTPSLRLNILEVLGQNNQLAPWIEQGFKTENMVVTPIKTFEAGKTVATGTFCEPHNCGSTQWTFAYQPQTQALVLQQGDTVLFNRAAESKLKDYLYVLHISGSLDQLFWD